MSQCVNIIFVVLLQITFNVNCVEERAIIVNEDTYLYGADLIIKHGYPCEVHQVLTEDGYILQLHRIPRGKSTNNSTRKAPVIVQHGLLGSSDDFVLLGPGRALAYLLADGGYDVWLVNSRGTRYSRNHTSLDPVNDAEEYWNFSWHELGIYDNPAIIDYVLNVTKREKVFHIGFSQGTTAFYVMGSEKPEYLDKVITHISYAPVAYTAHMTSPLFRTVALSIALNLNFEDLIGEYEFFPKFNLVNELGGKVCSLYLGNQLICKTLIFLVYGFNPIQLDTKLVPVIASHFPAGAGTKQIVHYSQLILSARFCQFNYANNLQHYGTSLPPSYNLSRINTPMHLFHSALDWIATVPDVLRLSFDLVNSNVQRQLVDGLFWTHGDFLYGRNAKEKVYDKTIAILNGYNV